MNIAVYGASGHTGGFVIAELLRRGHAPIAIGRDIGRTAAAAAAHGTAVEARAAGLDAPEAIDRALAGAAAVINCAGPFLDTAEPLIEGALRAGIHYVDVTAEQASARATFASFDRRARDRGVVVAPAVGFYGGFSDLLATATMRDWPDADRIDVAIALDRWWPTAGTRQTGARNTVPRVVVAGGALREMQPSAPISWDFDEPFGTQTVVAVPFAEMVLVARHLAVRDVRNYLNEAPLNDLRDPETPGPPVTDELGRSNQHFLVEVAVRRGSERRSIVATGRDIYATTAPLAVEAVERICRVSARHAGAFALGELVDATSFLDALVAGEHIQIASR